MSGYYENQMRDDIRNGEFNKSYDRDYAVIKRIGIDKITVGLVYNCNIQQSDTILGQNMTIQEARNLLNSFK